MENPAEEIVTVVDRDNRVVGSATRRKMRESGLPHRATYILIFDRHGRLYVQHRTPTKDIYPGYLDPAAGGVVLAGESYEDSAARELHEEMGIQGAPIETLFDFWFEEGHSPVWGRAFLCRWDGPIVPQPEEVSAVSMFTPAELLELQQPVTPDGLLVVRRWLEMRSGPETNHS